MYTVKLHKDSLRMTLGTDPEFEHLSDWETYNPIRTTIPGSTQSKIGKDGSGEQIELRPQAESTAQKLVKNLRELIKDCPSMSTRGDIYPLGGHIHFGGVVNPDGKKVGNYEEVGPRGGRLGWHTYNPTGQLISALDDFIGKPTSWANGFARSHYRGLGKFELKPYGFEYRSPSAAWMDTPDVAKFTLQLAKGIIVTATHPKGLFYDLCNDSLIPTIDSYKRALYYSAYSEGEIQDWLDYFRKDRSGLKSVNIYWGFKPSRRERRIAKPQLSVIPIEPQQPVNSTQITFTDDWIEEAKDEVRRVVELVNQSRILPNNLHFYGLREDRGPLVVAGGDANGFVRVTTTDALHTFGLPYILRTRRNYVDQLGSVVLQLLSLYPSR